ncbi:oligosaccharide flippase family protein [Nocardioides sp. SYSU D00038]|uniref:oligosaccharide flippase family protein n=1 Tax=Nocardioides sp. SYSU D00038 TaxID=2812554 RepID=UPI001966E552|nr:oligosaccharide flippase family protein [Nocardioides sp. SYSU D00038]
MAEPADRLLSRLGGGSLLTLAGALASAVSTLLLVVLTTRLLAPHDAGLVFGVTSGFLLLAALLRSGTPTGVVLFVSRDEHADAAHVRAVARLATRPVLLVSVLVALAAAPAAAWLADRWRLEAGPAGVATVLVLLAGLPAAALLDTVLAVSRGRHDMRPTVVVDRLARPLAQLALTAVAAVHPTVLTVTLAWTLPWIGALAAAWWLTPALRGPVLRGSRPTPAPPGLGRELARFVVPRGVTTLIQAAFQRLDIVLVAWLAGPAEAALYTAATRFVVVVQLVQQAVAAAGEPALGRSLAAARRADALAVFRTSTAWVVALVWPLLVAAAVLAPEWLTVFGDSYDDGVPVVLVLVAAMLVATASGANETVLNMAGRAGVLVTTNAAALAVLVGLDLWLVPSHGATGAAIGWAAAIVVKNLSGLVLARRVLPGSPLSRPAVLGAALGLGAVGLLPVLGWATGADRLRVVTAVVGCTLVPLLWLALRRPLGLDPLLGRLPLRTLRLGVALVAATVAAAGTLVAVAADGRDDARPGASAVLVGAAVDQALPTSGPQTAAYLGFDDTIGARTTLAHLFRTFDEPVLPPDLDDLVASGKQVMVSWNAADAPGIAAGVHDDVLRAAARDVREADTPLLLRFRWEMDRPNLRSTVGSPETYVAAWRHARAIFAEEGADRAAWVWCPTAAGFEPGGDAARFYPGDDQVDWLCVDAYPFKELVPLADLLAPFLAWARDRPHPVMIGEFGVPRIGTDAERAAWISAAGRWLAGQPSVRGVCYFSLDVHDDARVFQFALDPGSRAARAYGDVVRRLTGDTA